jgi:hypothetical protein
MSRRIRIRFGPPGVPWPFRAGVAFTLLAAAAQLAALPWTPQWAVRWQEPAWAVIAAVWARLTLSEVRTAERWRHAYTHVGVVRKAYTDQLEAAFASRWSAPPADCPVHPDGHHRCICRFHRQDETGAPVATVWPPLDPARPPGRPA